MGVRSKRRKKRQQRRRRILLTALFLCACMLMIVTFAILHSRKSTETAVPPAAVTETVQPIEAPTEEPTEEPTPEPIPEPTEEPVPLPTENSVPETADAPLEEPVRLVLHFGGDCTLGCNMNGTNRRFAQAAKKFGYGYFLENFADLFAQDDLTVVNLEGPLTEEEKKRSGREFNFRGSPEYARILSVAHVEAATVANNHARDYLDKGLSDTAKACEAEGITCFGFTKTASVTVKGVKIALIGVTQWDVTAKKMTEMVKSCKKENDIVIVYYHWGEEKAYAATNAMKTLGHKAVNAGADLVIGSHPHVPGGIEIYRGKRIVYSLGNFCFGGNDTPFTSAAYIYEVSLDFDPKTGESTVAEEKVLPIRTYTDKNRNDFKPYPLTGKNAVEVLKIVAKCSRKFAEKPDFEAMAAVYSEGA